MHSRGLEGAGLLRLGSLGHAAEDAAAGFRQSPHKRVRHLVANAQRDFRLEVSFEALAPKHPPGLRLNQNGFYAESAGEERSAAGQDKFRSRIDPGGSRPASRRSAGQGRVQIRRYRESGSDRS